MNKTTKMIKRLRIGATARVKVVSLALSAVAIASSAVMVATASPAAAGSGVSIGGTATCTWYGNQTLPAVSVTTRLDTGVSVSVGTSGLPWKSGRYDATLSYVPSGGSWATVTITCSRFSLHPGAHSYRAWYKPDWRNTTGDHSWTRI